MNIMRIVVCGLVLLGCLVGGMLYAGEDDITLNGQFVWERGDGEIPGDLKAVFTPSGENSWDVMFHFEWEEEMRAWAGSASGSLKSGELEGEGVEERDRERTFHFRGSVEDGVFTGEHGGMRDGEWRKSGTLTLK